jgi:hypothetical protein
VSALLALGFWKKQVEDSQDDAEEAESGQIVYVPAAAMKGKDSQGQMCE